MASEKNKVLWAYIAADLLFLIMGVVMIGFAVVVQNEIKAEPTDGEQAARNLLYSRFPLTAGIINAIFFFVTFVTTIPAIATHSRGWLKISAGFVAVTSTISLVLGLYIWILTLKTKNDFIDLWKAQTPQIQDLMQTTFTCCGYFNSSSPAFVTNPTCPSPAAAAIMRGCAIPIASFANIFVDDIFTAIFGMTGVGGVLTLATACLYKDRKERERFAYIDRKNGNLGGATF